VNARHRFGHRIDAAEMRRTAEAPVCVLIGVKNVKDLISDLAGVEYV
jgi:hypothetical protein